MATQGTSPLEDMPPVHGSYSLECLDFSPRSATSRDCRRPLPVDERIGDEGLELQLPPPLPEVTPLSHVVPSSAVRGAADNTFSNGSTESNAATTSGVSPLNASGWGDRGDLRLESRPLTAASSCHSILNEMDASAAMSVLRSRLGTPHKRVAPSASPPCNVRSRGVCSGRGAGASASSSLRSFARNIGNGRQTAGNSVVGNPCRRQASSPMRGILKGVEARASTRKEMVMFREGSDVRFSTDKGGVCRHVVDCEPPSLPELREEPQESLSPKGGIRSSEPLPPIETSERPTSQRCCAPRIPGSLQDERDGAACSKIGLLKRTGAAPPEVHTEGRQGNHVVKLPPQTPPVNIPCVHTGSNCSQPRGRGGPWGSGESATQPGEWLGSGSLVSASPTLPVSLPTPWKVTPPLAKDRITGSD